MSFNQTDYPSAAGLTGNVEIPRNVNPLVRSSKRRQNPDGLSSAPYYGGAGGKTLRVNYTTEVSSVVTEQQEDIALTGDSLAGIIADINAIDPTNLQALDLDGFLALKNLNPGKTHHLYVEAFSTPSSDAASILGFAVYPLPGSASYAGEIAAAPGNRSQQNPHGTVLIAKDETLSAASVNRGMASILQMLEEIRAAVSKDVIVYKDVELEVVSHPNASAYKGCWVEDDTLRVFYPVLPSATAAGLEPYFRVLNADGTPVIPDSGVVKVTNLLHCSTEAFGGTPDDSAGTEVWDPMDGKSFIAETTANVTKHESVSVTSIVGNIVHCEDADFVAGKVAKGDPVELTASNHQPFDHSGWFAVDAVIDGTHLALRPMVESEVAPSDANRPLSLNPSGGGTLRVAIGQFVPGSHVFIRLNSDAVTPVIIRMPVGVPFREAVATDLGRNFEGTLDKLHQHITASADAHAASAISGFVSTVPWNGGWFSGDVSSIQATIEDIIADLSSTDSEGNTRFLGAAAVSIGGSAPNSIPSGSIRSQLTYLLTQIQSHLADGGMHAGGAATYSGSPNWADGQSIPAGVTIDGAIDQVVADLAKSVIGDDGAQKIGLALSMAAWAGGRPWSATNVRDAIIAIIAALESTTAADDGAERVGAAAATDLTIGSVRSQLDQLASGWGKLSRGNVWTAEQSVNGVATDTAPSLKTTYVPTTRKLLWEASLESVGAGNRKARLYAGRNDVGVGYEVVINARWDTGTSTWSKDGTGSASRLVLIATGLYLQQTTTNNWADNAWGSPLYFSTVNPATVATAMGPSVTPKNVCRAHGVVVQGVDFFSNPIVSSNTGFNYTVALGTAGGKASLDITFASPLASTAYTVTTQCEASGYAWIAATIESKTVNGFRIILRNPHNSFNAFGDFTSGPPTGVGGCTVGFTVHGD